MTNQFREDELDIVARFLKEQRNWEVDTLSYKIIKRIFSRKLYSQPDKETIHELIKRVEKFDLSARWTLVLTHVRWVIGIARSYQNLGLPLNDLISEGIIGLIEASRHIIDRGFSFKTLAIYHVKAAIHNALNKYGSNIKNANKINRKIQKFQIQFYQEFGTDPTIEEIVAATGFTEGQVNENLDPITEISIDGLMDHYMDYDFVDELVNSKIKVEESIVSPAVDLASIPGLDYENIQEGIMHILRSSLYDRERDIIRMLYGIATRKYSLQETASLFDLSPERIRQIKAKAIEKIKRFKLRELSTFWESLETPLYLDGYNPISQFLPIIELDDEKVCEIPEEGELQEIEANSQERVEDIEAGVSL